MGLENTYSQGRLDSFRGVSVFLFAHLRLSDAYLESSWWVDGGLVLGEKEVIQGRRSSLISIVQGRPLTSYKWSYNPTISRQFITLL